MLCGLCVHGRWTSLSVFVALFVGVIELVQILVQVLGLRGGVFDAVSRFNFLGVAGYVIVAAFIVTWAGAIVFYKVRRIDERWSAAVDRVA